MRIPIGLLSVALTAALGACDDSEPVPGGESGSVSDDDDGGGGTTGNPNTTSPTTTGVSTTSASGPTTDTPTTSPTPTTMDPTDPGDSSGETTDATSSGCTPGTQGCECDQGGCNDGLLCSQDVCVLDVDCGVDIYEDNNTEVTAADLGEITDDDDDAVTFSAVLEGDEVDWFTYLGDDTTFSTVNPARELSTVGALRMCKFAECVEGLFSTELTCPEGTVAMDSPEGRPGCCGTDSFEVELDCGGILNDDDTRIWIRFDQGVGDCTPYTLEYHY
jgi:hypothetical protein